MSHQFALKASISRLEKKQRLYHCLKPILGITGGIATGKTSFSNILINKGFEIVDADKLIKKIYQDDEVITFLKNYAQNVFLKNDEINFSLLRSLFFSDAILKDSLEEILFRKLPQLFKKVIEDQEQDFIIYDAALILEKKLNLSIDSTTLVYAPENIQIQRLMNRDHIDLTLAKTILKNQMPIESKKTLSSYVIENTSTLENLKTEAKKWIDHHFQH